MAQSRAHEPAGAGWVGEQGPEHVLDVEPLRYERPVGVGIARADLRDARARLLEVPVEGDRGVRSEHRVESPRIHLEVLQAELVQPQFVADSARREQHVQSGTDVDLITLEDLLGGCGTADHRSPLHDGDLKAALGQVTGAHQTVVASADNDDVVLHDLPFRSRHGRDSPDRLPIDDFHLPNDSPLPDQLGRSDYSVFRTPIDGPDHLKEEEQCC